MPTWKDHIFLRTKNCHRCRKMTRRLYWWSNPIAKLCKTCFTELTHRQTGIMQTLPK